MKLHSRIWVYLFFFVSGATGLIYEVIWTRLLTLVMGNTQYSVATVLTLFMGGLALGSFLGGRLVDRQSSPLKMYALLEAAIGIYCFLIPSLIDAAFPVFQWIYAQVGDSHMTASLYRFVVCGAILLIPTSLMGATLPVLGKFITRDERFIGRDVGTLYATNTFGAVLGAFCSGIVLIRLFGVQAANGIAALLNISIAVFIWRFFLNPSPSTGEPAVEPKSSSNNKSAMDRNDIQVLMVFAGSGVCAMIYQIAWNRIFSLLLGSSIYAFSLILTTFILGLALGTAFFSRVVNRFGDLYKLFAYLQAGIGISALIAIPFFGEIPFLNRWVYQTWNYDFLTVQAFMFLVIFAFLFIPTFLLGGQFPVVVKMTIRRLTDLGENVGRVYSANTIGAIVGAFCAGFFLIPGIGVQESIKMAIFLNLTFAVFLIWKSPSTGSGLKIYGAPLIAILCVMGARMVGDWDKAVISSGSFMPYRIEDLGSAEKRENKILFYQEGMHTTVTVELAISGNVFLRVNGKTDASLALDMRTQLLSGYLPMSFHKDPKSVLVVGQGSGITLGAVERFPEPEAIDLVEISSAVLEGSRYFSPFNHNALEDSRVNLVVEDGRNHIALTPKKYDVIISEPSNPWIAGVGALFTRDFFELARGKLTPDGVFCIWVHTNMSPEGFKSIVRSYVDVFPYATLWESIVGDDYLLIGSPAPLGLLNGKIKNLLANPSSKKDLNKIGIYNAPDLMSLMILDRDGLVEFSAKAPIHTDDNALLEFSAPQYIYKDERSRIVRQLGTYFKINPDLLKFDGIDREQEEETRSQVASLKRSESQVAEIKRKVQIDHHLDLAQSSVQQGNWVTALENYRDILKIDSEHVLTYYNLGNVLMAMKRFPAASAAYRKTLELNPHYIFGALELAKSYFAMNHPDKAVEMLSGFVKKYPQEKELRFQLGVAYAFDKKVSKAIHELEQATLLDPEYALPHFYLGLQYEGQDPVRARKSFQQFIKLADNKKSDKELVAKAENFLNKR